MYKNLALQGGGVRGIGHAGAWSALNELGLAAGIDNFAGTSAGSLFALLPVLEYSSPEIDDIIENTDFKSFEDGNLVSDLQVFETYGIHPGNVLLSWIQNKIAKKGLSPLSTFRDFRKAGLKNLIVYAASLNSQGLIKYSFDTTPDDIVSYSVRQSASIPLFFQAVKMPNKPGIIVDGGTLFDYPLTTWDSDLVNMETLGFHFIGGSSPASDLDYGQFRKYIVALAETALNAQEVFLKTAPGYKDRTIEIPTHGISATNFGITKEEQQLIYQGARLAVMHKLAR